MSNPATLVQKLWNYCNMGSLAPARSGLRLSAPQNPFRSFPSGPSLRDGGLFGFLIYRKIRALKVGGTLTEMESAYIEPTVVSCLVARPELN